jgi:putative transposase
MVILAVELNKHCLKVCADGGKDAGKVVENLLCEDVAPVFCYEDQMHVHHKYAVSSVSNVVVIAHRPKYNRAMQRLQAYKYELMPNGEQQRQMRRFAGSCRIVFNEALALQKAKYEAGEKKLGYAGLCKMLTDWRHGVPLPSGRVAPWLREAPVHPLQQTLKDLERAYRNFFEKRADFPRFKKKGMKDSFRYPDPKQIKLEQGNSRVFLPKLGWLRYRMSREALGEVRNATVSLSAGKWFVSIQTEREVEQSVPEATTAVGIDMGVARFATLSDGTFYAPLSSFRKHERRLARYQRAMSRKQKFSNNWKKAKAEVQRMHARIGNARRDYLHKCSTTISKNHAMVCIEDLQVKNMSRSASGTADVPGKHVRAKSGLNKSILDQGWFEFRRQLDYKLQWNGGWLIAVPPQNTSRTCPACGHVSAENRQTQARFACVECGFEENADVVGAINILARGHRVAACGETARSGRSMKQEPAEARYSSNTME